MRKGTLRRVVPSFNHRVSVVTFGFKLGSRWAQLCRLARGGTLRRVVPTFDHPVRAGTLGLRLGG